MVETEAPTGYNKLTAPVTVTTQKIGEVVTATSGKIYYDADGNVTNVETNTYKNVVTYNEKLEEVAVEIVNQKGVELPSTGGMGTTLFYIMGSALAVAAVILLVTKKRMSSAQ